MAEMKSKQPKADFKSYIRADSEAKTSLEVIKPKLLPGELEITSADNVVLYSPLRSPDHADNPVGCLLVTNFRLSFNAPAAATAGPADADASFTSFGQQENQFLRSHDVTLANIDSIYQGSERKRRPIVAITKIAAKPYLFVVCKNFRVLNFRIPDACAAKKIAEALMRFAFPNKRTLQFAYQYREHYYNTLRNVTMFGKASDWKQELVRCGATGWRVYTVDTGLLDGTLPAHYVVPRKMTDSAYETCARYFRESRAAIWVFGVQDAALVRMAELSSLNMQTQENIMLEHVRACNATQSMPELLELSRLLPSVQDVHASYTKLMELCTPHNALEFWNQDQRYYALLDKSSWLLHVSLCLEYAKRTAGLLRAGTTVVLQECEGRDMSCVLSSLTQILLDPLYRTMNGFASLVQKDWVALGHPFGDRLGHVINDTTIEQSPLLLLFLDCVWQLLQQFPAEFEYNETFLTTVWDSAFMPLFDTFLFNSERDRLAAVKNEKLILRPVWDWSEQFADKDQQMFVNLLYRRPEELAASGNRYSLNPTPGGIRLPGMSGPNKRQTLVFGTPAAKQPAPVDNRYLEPRHHVSDLAVWQQCYHRWLSVLNIPNGGRPQIDLYQRHLLGNVTRLQRALQTGDMDDLPARRAADDGTPLPAVGAFFPFGDVSSSEETNASAIAQLLAYNVEQLADGSIFEELSVSQPTF